MCSIHFKTRLFLLEHDGVFCSILGNCGLTQFAQYIRLFPLRIHAIVSVLPADLQEVERRTHAGQQAVGQGSAELAASGYLYLHSQVPVPRTNSSPSSAPVRHCLKTAHIYSHWKPD
jgi:hypothetical protein